MPRSTCGRSHTENLRITLSSFLSSLLSVVLSATPPLFPGSRFQFRAEERSGSLHILSRVEAPAPLAKLEATDGKELKLRETLS